MLLNIKVRPVMFFLTAIYLLGCTNTNKPANRITVKDEHSFAKPLEAVVTHLDLDLKVDFATKTLSGKVTHTIRQDSATGKLWLDTRDIAVSKVTVEDKPVKFVLHPLEKNLGEALEIDITKDADEVTVYYTTAPTAEAVQWLLPEQTAGGKKPFLFTQGEAILTRSWIPCQDSPGIRASYSATINTGDTSLMAVMSATNPVEKNSTGIYKFEMKQPISAYLIALGVGDLAFKPVSDMAGVYAEPVTLEKAHYEFGRVQDMINSANELYGQYAWERYDILVLPPSFPFGGMENPRLTFATPTILAGDRSLTSLIAHELAHSWSGNLVTNATWNDFWLNEGFTVYFERRIMEKVNGAYYADMLSQLGYEDLQGTLKDLGIDSPDTRLKLDLKWRNPDDGMNDIAYEKGYFLLKLIEQRVGREKFDAFLKDYFKTNAFQTMTTEKFLEVLDANLLKPNNYPIKMEEVKEWVYNPGLPANCPKIESKAFAAVETMLETWLEGQKPDWSFTKPWSTHERVHFLRKMPQGLTIGQMEYLDDVFHFTGSTNSEIEFEWYLLAIKHNYRTAMPAMEEFLENTGRRKFIAPIYKALAATPQGKEKALEIYSRSRKNYHFVATNTIDALLDYKPAAPAANL